MSMNWIYDERGGMVAVYSGEKQLDCLELPGDSFIYRRYWERLPEGPGFLRIEEDCQIGRLIAAAPELLSALKDATYALDRALSHLEHGVGCDCSVHRDVKRGLAAIDKAEGKLKVWRAKT